MAHRPAPQTVTLNTADLIARLETAKAELEALAPAPRTEVDREAVLALVTLSLQALLAQEKAH